MGFARAGLRFAKALFAKRCGFQDYDYRAGESGVFPLETDPLGRQDSTATEKIRLSLAGDWGTGTHEAAAVTEGILRFKPHFTIHLGDVYYIGGPTGVAFHRTSGTHRHRRGLSPDGYNLRANIYTGGILCPDARFGDDVGHWTSNARSVSTFEKRECCCFLTPSGEYQIHQQTPMATPAMQPGASSILPTEERGLEDLGARTSRKTHDIVCVILSERMSISGASPHEESRRTACESRRDAFRR
jgi:hypothetical protein